MRPPAKRAKQRKAKKPPADLASVSERPPVLPSGAGGLFIGSPDATLGWPRKSRSAVRDAPAQRRLHGARRHRRDAWLRACAEEVPGLAAGRPDRQRQSAAPEAGDVHERKRPDRKSTRLNSSH